MLRRFAFSTLFVSMIGVGALHAQTPTIAITPELKTNKVTAADAGKAVAAFQTACTPLFARHAADIVKIEANAQDGWSQRAMQWGWGAEISISVQLKETTSTFDPMARANGHTLWYFLGGGNKPGYQAQKRISQIACGLPGDGPDAFVPIPELAALLPPAAAPAAVAKGKHVDDIAKALKGDYQAQRNVAYCYLTGCGGLSDIDIKMACAWRLVIQHSKSPRLHEGDRANLQHECGKAQAAGQFEQAKREAGTIFSKVYGRALQW